MKKMLVAFAALLPSFCAYADAFDDYKRRVLDGELDAVLASKAGELVFSYENFYVDRDLGRSRVVLKLTNKTGAHIDMAFIECAFMDKNERALDTAALISSNIPNNESSFVDGWSSQDSRVDKVSCRVARYR